MAYRRQWKEWGFEEQDFEDGGSDRLIDAVVAWGSEDQIRAASPCAAILFIVYNFSSVCLNWAAS